MKPLSMALTGPQSLPGNSSPGPVHPSMSPLQEMLSNCHHCSASSTPRPCISTGEGSGG